MFLSLNAALKPEIFEILGFDVESIVGLSKPDISLFIPCILMQIFNI